MVDLPPVYHISFHVHKVITDADTDTTEPTCIKQPDGLVGFERKT